MTHNDPAQLYRDEINRHFDDIRTGFRLFLAPGQVTELRVLAARTPFYSRPHVESGYFNDIDALATAAVGISPCANGVYSVINLVNPALIARAVNRLRPVTGEPLTSDRDILRRDWLPLDFDPVRPAGISASDVEHELALARALEVRDWLSGQGWPEPIYVDSGNGAHLDYRIELPVDDGGLVANVLSALSFLFDNAKVKIDRSVHNPARIWKVVGTLARKGDHTIDRPHRVAKLLQAPSNLSAVPTCQLEKIAKMIPSTTSQFATRSNIITPRRNRQTSFDLAGWIAEHNVPVDGPHNWDEGRRWIFPTCPWNSDHSGGSAYIVQFPNGAIAAGCHHDSCHGNNWHALRDSVEPGWRERDSAPSGIVIPDGTPTAIRREYRRTTSKRRSRRSS